MRKMLLLGVVIIVLLAGIGARADEAPKCSEVESVVARMQADLSSAVTYGDAAAAIGEAYATGNKITAEQADALYNGTNSMDTALEGILKGVTTLDSRFPSGRDVKLQLLHIKIGTYAEPILAFRRFALQRMMAATLCMPDAADFIDCQAQPLSPLYLYEKEGKKIQLYTGLKTGLIKELPNLKAFLLERCQNDEKAGSNTGDCPTCTR